MDAIGGGRFSHRGQQGPTAAAVTMWWHCRPPAVDGARRGWPRALRQVVRPVVLRSALIAVTGAAAAAAATVGAFGPVALPAPRCCPGQRDRSSRARKAVRSLEVAFSGVSMSVVRIVQQRLEIPHAVRQFHDLFLQEAGVSARGAAAVLRRREDVHGTRSMRSAEGVESRGRGWWSYMGTPEWSSVILRARHVQIHAGLL